MPRKSCVEYNIRIHVNCGVEPRVLFMFELNLVFIDSDTIRLSCELLVVVISVGLIPVLNRGSASFDAELLTEISTLR